MAVRNFPILYKSSRRRRSKTPAVLTMLVLAAAACQSDHSYASGPAALIADGNHGGNAFFFWLPPLVNQQAPPGEVFSNHLRPTVTISNLCSGAVVRTFADSAVQVGNGAFQASWPTAADDLDSTCTYRIVTTTGARQLGVVDVAIAAGGTVLKNVDTGDEFALPDDRTVPIQFFIGVGSQCERTDSDCGEGTAEPGRDATILTLHNRAGVFIPAGALEHPMTIALESSDDRPCIANLLEPVFPGDTGPLGNACYDIHTDPPLTQVNASGRFNTSVTVGICAPEAVGSLDHVTRDLLQIFQLHIGANPAIRALNNVRAPFLSCDPSFPQLLETPPRGTGTPSLAARLRAVLHAVAAPLLPRPLHASTVAMFDVGAGGNTDLFSRFTWALPSQMDFNFDQAPDLSAILPGATVNSIYSHVGVTLSRTRSLTILCPGTNVYANDYGLLGTGLLGAHSGQNNISVCPLGIASDFSDYWEGEVKATFALPAAQACITATPTGYHTVFPLSGGVAFIDALDANGNVVGHRESTSQRVAQRLCVNAPGIAAVRFAGRGGAFAIFDDLQWTRVLAPSP